MAGYCDFSKSNNAVQAESMERFPVTQAAKVLAKKLGWSIAKAKAFLQEQGTSEWHHTSCKYNKTSFYDVSDEHIAYITDELNSFVFVAEKKQKKEEQTFLKCWNWDRYKNEPRRLEWSITSRAGNYTHSLESVRATLLSVKATLECEHVGGHKTKDRILCENIAAIEEILAALT